MQPQEQDDKADLDRAYATKRKDGRQDYAEPGYQNSDAEIEPTHDSEIVL